MAPYRLGRRHHPCVPSIGLDREHCVPFAVELVYDRHEQCLTRPACLHEQAALEQRIAVAGAGLIIGVAPSLNHAEGIQETRGRGRLAVEMRLAFDLQRTCRRREEEGWVQAPCKRGSSIKMGFGEPL
jgi:hypothetical protein